MLGVRAGRVTEPSTSIVEGMGASLDGMIACARRELAMRERTYPHAVKTGRMKQIESDLELQRMGAIFNLLLRIQREKL